jgi:hypothetical protein
VVTALAQRGFDVVVTDRSIGGHARGRRAGGRAMAAGAAISVDGGMHLHY